MIYIEDISLSHNNNEIFLGWWGVDGKICVVPILKFLNTLLSIERSLLYLRSNRR